MSSYSRHAVLLAFELGYKACERGDNLLLARSKFMLPEAPPVPMLLNCPSCGEPHVDKEQPEKQWFNPPHRTHQCQTCLHEWRPANVPTVGVQELPHE